MNVINRGLFQTDPRETFQPSVLLGCHGGDGWARAFESLQRTEESHSTCSRGSRLQPLFPGTRCQTESDCIKPPSPTPGRLSELCRASFTLSWRCQQSLLDCNNNFLLRNPPLPPSSIHICNFSSSFDGKCLICFASRVLSFSFLRIFLVPQAKFVEPEGSLEFLHSWISKVTAIANRNSQLRKILPLSALR